MRSKFFTMALLPTTGTLTLEFTGGINASMAGFYRSQYVDATGAKKFMGCTQVSAQVNQ